MNELLFKLTSGETVIAQVIDKSDKCFTISKPMTVYTGVTQDQLMTMSLINWLHSASDTIDMDSRHIITTAVPSSELLEYYNEVKDESLDNDDYTNAPAVTIH